MSTLAGMGQASLSDDDGFNAVQPEPEKLFMYVFVESIEPVYRFDVDTTHPGEALDGDLTDEIAYWIELDGITAYQFDGVMQSTSNYREIDPSQLDPADSDIIEQRKNLLDEMHSDPNQLGTVYLYITADHEECGNILAGFPVGTWQLIAIEAADEDMTPEEIEEVELSDAFIMMVANDPYDDTFVLLDDLERHELEDEGRQYLEEVFSLNHVVDIDLPDDGGGGSAPPLPTPVPNTPPPVIEFGSLETFLAGYGFRLQPDTDYQAGGGAFCTLCEHLWGKGFDGVSISIENDIEMNGWLLSCAGYTFHTKAEENHAVWRDQSDRDWRLYYFAHPGFGVALPHALCKEEGAMTPEYGFEAMLVWPPQPESTWVKVEA